MEILVADDDAVTTEFLAGTLERAGYRVTQARDGGEAFRLLRTGRFRLLISDWEMPECNGPELCQRIRNGSWAGYVYVILLTCHRRDCVVAALEAGADDFMTKPVQPRELLLRVRTGERVLSLECRNELIFALAKLAESRDQATVGHLERIREYCCTLAEELSRWERYRNEIDGEYIELLHQSSPLHDIGKLGIPDLVLLKAGQLNVEEFNVMKQHTVIGGQTLEAVSASCPGAKFLGMAREIALWHHERFDGEGYPHGLAGESIPLCARIMSVADVYDALTSRRVYKPAYPHQTARVAILEGCGTLFDPDVVEAFTRRESEIVAIRNRFGEPANHTADLPVESQVPAVAGAQ